MATDWRNNLANLITLKVYEISYKTVTVLGLLHDTYKPDYRNTTYILDDWIAKKVGRLITGSTPGLIHSNRRKNKVELNRAKDWGSKKQNVQNFPTGECDWIERKSWLRHIKSNFQIKFNSREAEFGKKWSIAYFIRLGGRHRIKWTE